MFSNSSVRKVLDKKYDGFKLIVGNIIIYQSIIIINHTYNFFYERIIPMLNDYPDVLTPHQLAEYLGVSKNYAYKLIKESHIGYRKIGHKILIPKICVEDFLESARVPKKT